MHTAPRSIDTQTKRGEPGDCAAPKRLNPDTGADSKKLRTDSQTLRLFSANEKQFSGFDRGRYLVLVDDH